MKKCYAFRRILLETTSAIHVGSGESDPIQDMPIQLDDNGLPIIHATSIVGVLRHLYAQQDADQLFGYQNNRDAQGSCLIMSDAVIVGENGRAVEGLVDIEKLSPYLKAISKLPHRDHCAINACGTAKKTAKFDRTVLLAGVRFMLEFHVIAENCDDAKAKADGIVALLSRPDFRLGGGTRNGFGQIRLVKICGKEYDLAEKADREVFLNRSASLAEDSHEPEIALTAPGENSGLSYYRYTLTPEGFWQFTDGCGLMDLDIRPKMEEKVVWTQQGPDDPKNFALLPATSIKGALAHRTAYYYNRRKGIFADTLTNDELKAKKEEANEAVKILFGYANNNDGGGQIGRVMISDIYCKTESPIFNHVKIDRFTGGALDGALFTEMAHFGGEVTLEICVKELTKKEDPNGTIMASFEDALKDLTTGMLPLGGATMRGFGVMKENNQEEA